ncbi:MAG: low molecular weight phosphatase family protein [Neomegalonema sp.]|nr:low molecular weight phosphatase family protein [Neomegalonema sp.]
MGEEADKPANSTADQGGEQPVHASASLILPGRILFACTYNSSRSPMAAALFRARYGEGRAAQSVGVYSGDTVEPLAVRAAAEIGVDLSDHAPQSFTDLETCGGDICDYDLIVALSPAAHTHALDFVRYTDVPVIHWPTLDPTKVDGGEDERLGAFRQMRDSLAVRIAHDFRVP